jgi:hypothetical protein
VATAPHADKFKMIYLILFIEENNSKFFMSIIFKFRSQELGNIIAGTDESLCQDICCLPPSSQF